jgi:AbrB family looped-hinge helix DNA binding protein
LPMAATEAHRARITSKGQITVPKTVRERLGVGPGDSLEFAVAEGAERAEVRPVRRRSIAEFRGIFGRGEGPRKVDEPFDWTAQRTRAWKAATARLTPPRGGGATSGGGGRGASGSRRG